MVIEIPKTATKEEIEAALKVFDEKIRKDKKAKGNVSHFFGANPSEIDGLEFQKKVRSEWD